MSIVPNTMATKPTVAPVLVVNVWHACSPGQ